MAPKSQSLLTSRFHRKPLFWIILSITLLGGFFRFYNPDWDFRHSFHPDERNILNAISELRADTGFKVRFFAYGQLPVYLYRATGELISVPQKMVDFFKGNGYIAQVVYWLFLLSLLAAVFWSFLKEKWRLTCTGLSVLLFLLALFLKFSNVFNEWFSFLDGQRIGLNFLSFLRNPAPDFPTLTVVAFAIVAVTSFGVSALLSRLLEVEWVGLPFFSACGATFLLGIVPALFPEQLHLCRIVASLIFTLLVAILGCWLAWVSKIGRILLLLFGLATFLAWPDRGWGSYTGNGEMMIIGRMWAAFFSTLTILAVYTFVKKAYGKTSMALLAAGSFAFAVVSIEQAHYCITESFITLMFVVMVLCSWEVARQGDWRNYLWTGAAFGLSMAAKTSSLYYVFILIAAHLVFLSRTPAKDWERQGKQLRENEGLYSGLAAALLAFILACFLGVGLQFRGILNDLFQSDLSEGRLIWMCLFMALAAVGFGSVGWGISEFKIFRAQMPQWLKLIAAGGVAFIVFFLFSPWSLLDYQGFSGSMRYEWDVVSHADACYVLQFKDTPRYLYQLQNLMHVELWWPLGVTVVLGAAWVLGRFLTGVFRPVSKNYLLPVPFTRGKGFDIPLADLLILCWFIPYFGFIGSWNTKFIRYMVPLIPAFCIFGGRLLSVLLERTEGFSWNKFFKPALLAAVLGSSLFYSLAYMNVYFNPHPWIEASVWIFKHVPPGKVIATEIWDDGLPTDVTPQMDRRVERPNGPGSYGHEDVDIYQMYGAPTDDLEVKKNYYIDTLQKGDYISLATKKLWYTLTDCTPEFRPHGYKAYPLTSRYFRLLWSGLLGYKMVGDFHTYPSLFGWEHPDDMAEESFSVYDHPRAYLFQKVADVPQETMAKLLGSDDYVRGIDRDLMRTITPENVDAFIAERRKYLEDHGLSKQLEEAAPEASTPAPVTESSLPSAQLPVLSPFSASRASSSPVTLPTPSFTPSADIRVTAPATVPGPLDERTNRVLKEYAEHPFIENDISHPLPDPLESASYQWRAWFTWLLLLMVLGWMALPLTLRLLAPLASGAYSLSKILGFFIFSWMVWFFTSFKCCKFTLGSCWFWFLVLAGISAYFYKKDWASLRVFYSKWGKAWAIQEGAFAGAFAVFTLVKIFFPHIHDPWGEGYNGGGEAGMDMGFLSSIVRGESFPPENMWMAGQPLRYSYYYGHLMMGILTKMLGLAPAVTYNLGLITLFATIFSCAYGLAFGLSEGNRWSGWIAGTLCAAAGNPAGARQFLENLHQGSVNFANSIFGRGSVGEILRGLLHGSLGEAFRGFLSPWGGTYDFFGPSRVIPHSINEFPYFSVVYGDMHSHTLAMPFAMLLIGIIASLYLSKKLDLFDLNLRGLGSAGLLAAASVLAFLASSLGAWGWTALAFWAGALFLAARLFPSGWVFAVTIGFLMGGLSFLNTWDVLTWGALTLLALLARNLPAIKLKPAAFTRGLGMFLGILFCSWALLKAWTVVFHVNPVDSLSLGADTKKYFAAFTVLGAFVGTIALLVRKDTKPMGKVFVGLALFGIVVGITDRVLWVPFFNDFVPQQSQILWVMPGKDPQLRSKLADFLGIYGLFLTVLLASFIPVLAKDLLGWFSRKMGKGGIDLDGVVQWLMGLWEAFIGPKTPLQGMMSLGLATLAAIWAASWLHWNEPNTSTDLLKALTQFTPFLFAVLASALFLLGVLLKENWIIWFGEASLLLLWAILLAAGVFHLFQDSFFTLQLGLFSLLWLLAFFHLGLALKNSKYGNLSFSYLLVSLFFFVVATLEVFVMKEYLSWDWMRNNSLFKFGIHAWILASVTTGIFLPKVLGSVLELLKAKQKESPQARAVMTAIAGGFLFVLARVVLGPFMPSLQTTVVYVIDIVLLCGFLAWAWMEGWLGNGFLKWFSVAVTGLLALFAVLACLQNTAFDSLVGLAHHWGEDLSSQLTFPAVLALSGLGVGYLLHEGQNNLGRKQAFYGWCILLALLTWMVSIYPFAASYRKAHGFFAAARQQWLGYKEAPTLNGMEYIKLERSDPYDAAAIRFLNEHIPDQPCLAEFVGAGYNTWCSRVSIFTGIPAIMGWDGHVREWLTGRNMEDDINQRKMAAEELFSTSDPAKAKAILDAYGVRLVMVGNVERKGAGDKGGYPAEGLAKFATFLPLIYKNPGAEIYYNPPPAN